MIRTGTWLAVVGLLGLAACDEAMMAEQGVPESGLPSPAQAACMSAVADRAGTGYVTVLSSTPSRGGSELVVGAGEVPEERRPWRCVASDQGAVSEVAPVSEGAVL